MMLARHKEAILIHTDAGNILELSFNENQPHLERIFESCRKFVSMCMLKPQESHIVVLDISNSLKLVDIVDGNVCTEFHIDTNDQVLCIKTHPYIPLLVVSTMSGKCIIFIASTKSFHMLKMIHLHRNPLERVKFSNNGCLFGAVSTEPSHIFLLRTIVKMEIKVFFHVALKKPIVDFLIFEIRETIRLVILVKTCPIAPAGDFIEIYSVNKWENSCQKIHRIHLHGHYQNLKYGPGNICDFMGIPYLLKQLHLFKIESDLIVLTNVLFSEHKLRKFDIITCGFDGFVILRENSNLSKRQKVFMVHHYQEKGAKKSLSSLWGKIILSLGKNGSLVCLKNCESQEESKDTFVEFKKNIETFKWEYIDIEAAIYNNKTLLELEDEKAIERERNDMLCIKSITLKDLSNLKTKIKRLLDLNETKSSECRLPVSTFDLDSEKRNKKINIALSEQEEAKVYLQTSINQKEKIIEYLMKSFWNTLETHDCTLISFNCKTYVNNFRLRHMDKPEKMDDFSIELFNTPLLSSCLEISNFETDQPILEPTMFQEILQKSNRDEEFLYLQYSNDIVFTGSTSFQWIKDAVPPNQLLTTVFDDSHHDIITSRENRLKIYFNKRFDEMRSLKNNVLIDMEDRLKRLTKCKKELKEVFGITFENDKFVKIKWQSTETPEDVVKIKEEEIPFEFQKDICLNNENEKTINNLVEAERTSMSVPDHEIVFRAAKLQDMMDGLLEVRWEDEVRKDVPKPECLLLKRPSQYDKIDIAAVEVYKQKMAKLEAERRKYKLFLETEINNINEQIKADVENFDRKMEEFALEKIKIKSAILQEFLLRLNDQKRRLLKDYANRKMFNIVNYDLVILENENRTLSNEVTNIEPIVTDLRNKYESLNKRDRVLEGKFRGEFAELKQPIVEHLLRQYKRRPRIGQITCTSLTYLVETNKCLMAGKKSAILPREYLDFLRGMDALDVMPNSLPPQIDTSHWQSLCKLRRNKVEIEIKLRIAALELAEAEQTFFYLQKLSSVAQSKIFFMKNTIEEETIKQSKFLKNPEIQLVLKAAQIEILITGDTSNFENAAVVTCKQLVDVNNEIIMEGEKKIAAMRALMKLKKSIRFRSWKYQCMFRKMKHLREHLTVLQKTKIGKEMQNYLVERLEDKIQYKDATSCDKMLKSVQRKFERMLDDERINLLRVLTEINYWSKMNVELITSKELFSLKKQKQIEQLEEDHLRKRNRLFHKNHLRSIMERTRLVETVKESHNELMNLQTQLELLKLKTYPTLRCKDASYYRRSILKKYSYT
ncbi:hypothetical protein TSAR_006187 [Trichomalopsis sarcophagae]|uniref:Cilia- and flagella-associated protein 43 n=1 Tax=Trichomalopsis sarcophagae TaxID=543379 RepID=A0A232FDM9_9HYME|nr:hypothetical protein TSAR_006187 [Trichomalopsis sarcophagae]